MKTKPNNKLAQIIIFVRSPFQLPLADSSQQTLMLETVSAFMKIQPQI